MTESKTDELNKRIMYAAEHMAELMSAAGQEMIEAFKANEKAYIEIFKTVNELTKEDKSRRRFEAVACKGRNRRTK